MSLIKSINDEIKRCNDVKELYDMLPNGQGAFGSAAIQGKINEALDVISNSDTIGMLKVYQELKEIN